MNIGVPLEDGSWVTQEMLDAAAAIYESYPELELMWIPRDKREPHEPIFAIVHRDTREVMFYINKEEELNKSILERIYLADRTRFTFADTEKQLGVNG